MKTSLLPKIVLVLLIVFMTPHFTLMATDFYVSPAGDDNNPGTSDQPFLTIERAKKAVIQVFQKDNREDCTVWLSEGTYEIRMPVIFKSSDLKNDKGELLFKSLPGEHPVISGGIKINNWQKNDNGLWVAELPEEIREDINPRELFINQMRCTRTRHPNEGYLRVKKVGSDRRTNFFFNEGDFPVPARDVMPELVLLHDWSISRIAVKEIDEASNKLTAVDSIGAKGPAFFNLDNWEPNPRYFLENAIEFLDADYEWFFDNSEKKIFLKIPETLTPENVEIMTPVSQGLIIMMGDDINPVKNIHFEGIAFRHSYWPIPQMGYCGVQACHYDPRPKRNGWTVVPAAVRVEWGKDCSFKDCSFKNFGGTGLWFATGCRNCSVSDSYFSDISGNGIMIGEGRDREVNGDKWWKTVPDQIALGNTVENCVIKECGVQFSGAVGIWCGLTAETEIIENEIHEMPYTGVSVGWMWSTIPTPCRENIIEGNHIHHIMKVLSDGGGIYTLGLQPGSKILKNHIHDVSINAGRAESNGMFLDEGTTDFVIANNLIYNIAKSPLRFHKATTNFVRKNYLFCSRGISPIRYNRTDEEDIVKVKNKVFTEGDRDYKDKLGEAIEDWE